jgi:NNP family nitrate/nitrite transporter-like MFS transporter
MTTKRKSLVFLITALLFAAQFIGNYGDYQVAAIPSSIYAAFHLTDMQFSSLITAPMLPCIFLSILIGLMVDRFGIPKIVGVFMVLAALGFLLRHFAGNYPVMLIAMALGGCGCMVVNSNIAKLAASLYPMDKVGTVVGILMAGSNAASALAFATTSMLPSLQLVLLIPTVASVIVFVLWAMFARESVFTQNQTPADAEKTPVLDSLKLCFKSRSLWLAGLTLFLILGGTMVLTNFHVSALTTLRGWSETLAGSFSSVSMVGAIFGSIFLPIFVTKKPEKAPLLIFIMLLVCAAAAYGMLALPAWGIYVCSFINGALRSGVIAVLMMTPVLLKEIGPKNAGTAGGFIITLQLIGNVVVPTYIVVPLGGGNLTAYFVLATVCMLLAAVVCFLFMKSCGAFDKKAQG